MKTPQSHGSAHTNRENSTGKLSKKSCQMSNLSSPFQRLNYSYFKKKGMKWPLSILSQNELAGFIDCNFDRKKKMFIVKEINIQKEKAVDKVGLYLTLCSLARFHEADDLIILGEKYHDYH